MVVETRATVKVVSTGVPSLRIILEDRESNPFVDTMDTNCNFHSNGKIRFVATLLQQLSRLVTTVPTLNSHLNFVQILENLSK